MAGQLGKAIDAFLEADAKRSNAQAKYQVAHDEVRRLMYLGSKTRVHRHGNLIVKDSGPRCSSGNLRIEQVKDVPD